LSRRCDGVLGILSLLAPTLLKFRYALACACVCVCVCVCVLNPDMCACV